MTTAADFFSRAEAYIEKDYYAMMVLREATALIPVRPLVRSNPARLLDPARSHRTPHGHKGRENFFSGTSTFTEEQLLSMLEEVRRKKSEGGAAVCA